MAEVVIGAGAPGCAIAARAVAAGIGVVLCARRSPVQAAARLGAVARAGTLAEAVAPEIVILAVPWAAVPAVLAEVPDWDGRILVDATNPPAANGARHPDPGGKGSSEAVAALAPGAQLVKCFNTLLACDPATADGRRVLFLCGDNPGATRAVLHLTQAFGFAGIPLGTLAEGGRLQRVPGGALALHNLMLSPS